METYHCLMLEKEGNNKMSIWSDIKKAAKGSKEYQKGKAKRKAKRAKSPLGKAVKRVAKDVKSAVKGSKEYQAGKAKKKAGKSWTKAVKAQKKTGGASMNELIKARNAAKKGSEAYATAQNKINKAYGSKKVHKADAPKKAEKKKAATKEWHPPMADSRKPLKAKAAKPTPSGPESPVGKKEYEAKPGQKSTMYDTRPKAKEGGLVEANPFGWPSSDSRKR